MVSGALGLVAMAGGLGSSVDGAAGCCGGKEDGAIGALEDASMALRFSGWDTGCCLGEAGVGTGACSVFSEVGDASTFMRDSFCFSGDMPRIVGGCFACLSVGVRGGVVALVETC